MTDAGRRRGVNLVDATVLLFLVALIPIGYATYLLFRPSTPQIESVTPSIITKEERRISSGSQLVAKFKVRGTGFTPLLRARIGGQDALGFVFESPNSADVLVGPIPPGSHDLVLVDGVQEVAIARGVISVQREDSTFVRAVGWLTGLDDGLVKALQLGLAFPPSEPAFEILALGPTQPARTTIRIGTATTQVPIPHLVEREAVLRIRCAATIDENPCVPEGRLATAPMPVDVVFAGPTRPFNLAITELLPPSAPAKARVGLRLNLDAPAAAIRSGDRDQLLDERAAIVSAIDRRGSATVLTLSLGLDEARGGWTYRGSVVRTGGPFTLRTSGYEVHGTIESIEMLGK